MSDKNNKLFFEDIISSVDFVKYLLKDDVGQIESNEAKKIERLPILKINTVLYPGVFISVPISDQESIKILETSNSLEQTIGVVAFKNSKRKDFYTIGTTANIVKIVKNNDKKIQILLQGLERFKILNITEDYNYNCIATVETLVDKEVKETSKNYKVVSGAVKDLSARLLDVYPKIPNEIKIFLNQNDNFKLLIYLFASGLNLEIKEKQNILAFDDVIKRAKLMIKILKREIEISEMKKKVCEKAQDNINKKQKEFFIKQQIDILRDELDNTSGSDSSELDELRKKGCKKKWPKKVMNFFEKLLDKAEKTMPSSADYMVLVNQAEFLLDLPWNNLVKEGIDIPKAAKILDENHYGMEKVKDRILEYLAVVKLSGKSAKGQIMCLVGPPGVGKTSLCKSIAKALNREFVKVALGGIDDEAEIRGHRKTYVGAMAGKILKGLQNIKSSNPVFVLDEIDKMTKAHGDPSAALLEVLDPDQNTDFVDHYAEVPYDLSKVFFIATANSLNNIPRPLLDRLEVIEVNGYAIEEKLEICKKYLIPKIIKEYGMKNEQLQLNDDIINIIIDKYTRESGVRELERQISKITRKICRNIVEKKEYNSELTEKDVYEYLGNERYERDLAQKMDIPGVAIGLAWTSVGGDILFIESSLIPGKGELKLSGKLGDVMKESAGIAFTYLKAHSEEYKIDKTLFTNNDVHIHLPDGATPKDGPSAGITLFTTLLSLYTHHKVKDNLAMTGELTLRGKVLPVGGIREKVLAAKRSGITQIIMCQENKKDVEEIKKEYISNVSFYYIENVTEISNLALA